MNTKPDVIQKCLWPACLVGLFIPGALSLHCNLLHLHLREVTWQNLRLLNSMSNSFPVECLRETRAFELPQDIQSHTPPGKRYLKEAFYKMSTQAFNIFRESTTKSTWKKKYLKQIQIRLDWQMHHLEKCFEEEEKGKEDSKQMEEDGMGFSGAMVSQVSSLELRRYFYRMYNFLKDKKYSHCAWEIIRVELRRCFYYFYNTTTQEEIRYILRIKIPFLSNSSFSFIFFLRIIGIFSIGVAVIYARFRVSKVGLETSATFPREVMPTIPWVP